MASNLQHAVRWVDNLGRQDLSAKTMPRDSLRTLLILLAIGPPLLAIGFWSWADYRAAQELKRTVSITGPGFRHIEEPVRTSLHDVLYESHANP